MLEYEDEQSVVAAYGMNGLLNNIFQDEPIFAKINYVLKNITSKFPDAKIYDTIFLVRGDTPQREKLTALKTCNKIFPKINIQKSIFLKNSIIFV